VGGLKIPFFEFLVVVVVLFPAACSGPGGVSKTSGPPRRIVALSPGLAETLFAVGCGDRVVGVSRFTHYPPEADQLPRLGGYLDLNREALVRLEPDMVFMMESQDAVGRMLEGMGIAVCRCDQHDLDAVLESFENIGKACGKAEEGRNLRRRISRELDELRTRYSALKHPGVLVVAGRSVGEPIGRVFAAGEGSLFDGLVRAAGGENLVSGPVQYPEISREGILALDPDYILDVIPSEGDMPGDEARLLDDWSSLKPLKAYRARRVIVLRQPWLAVPGPRIVETVRLFGRILHPEMP